MDLDLLEEMRDRVGASGMGKPALMGLVTMIVVVAVIAAGRLIGTATATDFQLEQPSEAAAPSESSVAEDDGTSTLYVHVSGEVVNPGLYEVASGARVADAVQAAGGFAPDAATGSVNLARVLADGEQIVVLAQSAYEGQMANAEGGASGEGGSVSAQGLVNINTATSEQLQSLPGIGKSTADKIVADRTSNGPFSSKQDLKRVSGIGDKKYEALADLICT